MPQFHLMGIDIAGQFGITSKSLFHGSPDIRCHADHIIIRFFHDSLYGKRQLLPLHGIYGQGASLVQGKISVFDHISLIFPFFLQEPLLSG